MDMQRKKIADRQTVINTLAVILVLCLFGYALLQLSKNSSVDVSTQRTQIITDESYASFKGYIFRDEHVVEAENAIADYPFRNGEKISVGAVFAEIYQSADGLSPEALRDGQKQINALLSQIELLEDSVSGSHRIADIKKVNEEIDRAYYDFIDAVSSYSFAAANMSGEKLIGGINDRLVMTGKLEETSHIITTLEDERQNLLLTLAGGDKQSLVAEESCYFYRETDGYEGIFDYSRVMSMTAEEFSYMLSASLPEQSLCVIGKKIVDPKWYAVMVADMRFCAMVEVGDVIDVTFADNGSKVIDMTVERVCPATDNSYAIVVFSSRELPEDFDFARMQSMRILTDSVSGYRVPSEAVVECYGERGVYILSGNIVEFRRITVIGQGDGYFIVNTYDGDDAEENLSDIPYLNINDLIITSGGNLYDGKILD